MYVHSETANRVEILEVDLKGADDSVAEIARMKREIKEFLQQM